jgi:hypothetical protein
MIIIDIPNWMLIVGWFFTQVFKIVGAMFILVVSLNKIDIWRKQ